MSQVLQHFRGVMGIGLTWGALWAGFAVSAVLVLGAIDPSQIDRGEGLAELGPVIALAGFICGIVFGSLLPVAEGRKAILELSLSRVAIWGALVSAALPLVMSKGFPELLVTVPVGAVSAVASVALVRAWMRGR